MEIPKRWWNKIASVGCRNCGWSGTRYSNSQTGEKFCLGCPCGTVKFVDTRKPENKTETPEQLEGLRKIFGDKSRETTEE